MEKDGKARQVKSRSAGKRSDRKLGGRDVGYRIAGVLFWVLAPLVAYLVWAGYKDRTVAFVWHSVGYVVACTMIVWTLNLRGRTGMRLLGILPLWLLNAVVIASLYWSYTHSLMPIPRGAIERTQTVVIAIFLTSFLYGLAVDVYRRGGIRNAYHHWVSRES